MRTIVNKTAGAIGLKSSDPLLNALAKIKSSQCPEEEVSVYVIKCFF